MKRSRRRPRRRWRNELDDYWKGARPAPNLGTLRLHNDDDDDDDEIMIWNNSGRANYRWEESCNSSLCIKRLPTEGVQHFIVELHHQINKNPF